MVNSFAKKRIAARIKQEEVAIALHVDRSTVSKWETGVAMPQAKKLEAIAKLYNCSVSDLLSDSEPDHVEKVV